MIHLAVDGLLMGVLAVSDAVKASTPEALAAMQAAGLRIVMASGDGINDAPALAMSLRSASVIGNALRLRNQHE